MTEFHLKHEVWIIKFRANMPKSIHTIRRPEFAQSQIHRFYLFDRCQFTLIECSSLDCWFNARLIRTIGILDGWKWSQKCFMHQNHPTNIHVQYYSVKQKREKNVAIIITDNLYSIFSVAYFCLTHSILMSSLVSRFYIRTAVFVCQTVLNRLVFTY